MDKIQLSRKLRALRVKHNPGQPTYIVSELIGLKSSALYNYEAGKVVPTLESIVKIADYYGVSIDEIIGREYQQLCCRDKNAKAAR